MKGMPAFIPSAGMLAAPVPFAGAFLINGRGIQMEEPANRNEEEYSLKDFCSLLSISEATGRNWIKLGKVQPAGERLGKPYFSASYAKEAKERLQGEGSSFLKSRRNKKYISGTAPYRNYIPQDSPNLRQVEALVEALGDIMLTEGQIRAVLAECAIQLLCQAQRAKAEITEALYQAQGEKAEITDVLCQAQGGKAEIKENFLLHYSRGEISLGQYGVLLKELLDREGAAYTEEQCLAAQEGITGVFCIPFVLEPNVDILGLLYISLKNIGERKAAGSYYTPTHIVQRLIAHLFPEKKIGQVKILDPCCGTGNFLLQLPDWRPMEQIHGRDIDQVSIAAARINMALKFPDAPVSLIKEQVRLQNFLLEETGIYGLILGNPPWGYQFSKEEEKLLKRKFQTAKGRHPESYDVFLEHALGSVPCGGEIAFVLPESALHVKSHLAARRLILEGAQIEWLEYLGDVFDKVQCPAVILQARKSESPFQTKGMEVSGQGWGFKIQDNRKVEAEYFNFHMTDKEYRLVEKAGSQGQVVFLKGQAEFALGIVTGNNKRFLKKEKTGGDEAVLRGADIQKYRISFPQCYLSYEPEKFQQCAKEPYYRAKEKLLYRFIGRQLVFAYDNQQRLSLNSCNILIPHVPGMDMKYIMAVLNSRAAQFLYSRKFHSLKVLRAYLEQMPIPLAAPPQHQEIISLAEQIIEETDPQKRLSCYGEIDRLVAAAYGYTAQEYQEIQNLTPKDSLPMAL